MRSLSPPSSTPPGGLIGEIIFKEFFPPPSLSPEKSPPRTPPVPSPTLCPPPLLQPSLNPLCSSPKADNGRSEQQCVCSFVQGLLASFGAFLVRRKCSLILSPFVAPQPDRLAMRHTLKTLFTRDTVTLLRCLI